MANINLLPWRAEERERRNREFVLQMLIVALLSMLLAFLGWTYFNSQLESQNEANEIVKQANTALDRNLEEIDELEKKRQDIVSRMEVIQKLQGTRPIPVHVFDSLVRKMPNNMFLTEISLIDKQLTLDGKADSPNTVSTLLRNLDSTRWLDSSAVKSIKTSAETYETETQLERKEDGTVVSIKPVAPEADYITFKVTSNLVDVDLSEKVKTDFTGQQVQEDGGNPSPEQSSTNSSVSSQNKTAQTS